MPHHPGGAIDMETQHGQSELGITVRETMPGGCSLWPVYDYRFEGPELGKPFPCTDKVSAVKWGHRRRMFSLTR